MRFILASSSPRRKELLTSCGYKYEVQPADADESLEEGCEGKIGCEILARRKALSVLEKNPDAVVLGADTMVVLDNKVLGKPKDKSEAENMLRSLSGKTHRVYTGLCVCSKDKTLSLVSQADVKFYELSDETIKAYVETGEPMDKAGAYGIQGMGAMLVKSIEGDYFTVVGLPLAKAGRMLYEFGVEGNIPLGMF